MSEDDVAWVEFACPVCHAVCDVDADDYIFTDDVRDDCTSVCPMCGAAVQVVASVEVTLSVKAKP